MAEEETQASMLTNKKKNTHDLQLSNSEASINLYSH